MTNPFDTASDFLEEFINFSEPNFRYALLSIIAAPILWNLLARFEFYTHLLTKIACGNKYLGCYLLAIYIFGFSAIRDHLYEEFLPLFPSHWLPL